MRPWTRKNVITALQQAGQESNKAWTSAAWKAQKMRPSYATITHLFGTWKNAWEAAGYSITAKGEKLTDRSYLRKWTRETIIAHIQMIYQEGQPISNPWWITTGHTPALGTIRKHFASLKEACEVAGVPYCGRLSEKAIREALPWTLRTIYQTLGYYPTRKDWDAWDARCVSSGVLLKIYGTWERVLQVGLNQIGAVPDHARSRELRKAIKDIPLECAKTEKERLIFSMVKEGVQSATVAQACGVTRQRVSQVVKRVELRAAEMYASI